MKNEKTVLSPSVDEKWEQILSFLHENEDITPRQLSLLDQTSLEKVVEDTAILDVLDEQTRYVFETRLYEIILDDVKKVFPKVASLVFKIVRSSGKKPVQTVEDRAIVEASFDFPKSVSVSSKEIVVEKNDDSFETNLNPALTFDTFVIGDSNKVAYASTVFVSEKPASPQYNPLYLYGSPGLGKTHLLNAIGNNLRTVFPHLKVFYTTASNYFNDFVETIGENNKAKKKEFDLKYRSVDVLLLDDVQFFTEKKSSSEQFLYLFNEMVKNKKQIVVAADVAPNKLEGIHERLLQRFCSSMYCAIDAPEFEMRVAFLKNFISKGSFCYNDGSKIIFSEEILNYIASAVSSSIRELEGAVNTVCNQAIINNCPITESLLEKILETYISYSSKDTNIIEIVETVSAYFGVSSVDVKGKSRTPQLVKARHFSIYICRQLTNMTLEAIGKFFNRDHTAIISAEKKINSMIKNKEKDYTVINSLIKKIKSS